MKNILVILVSLLTYSNVWAQVAFVETQNNSRNVIAPKEIGYIEGKPKQSKATDVIFQKEGEDIGVYGQLELVSVEEHSSTYKSEGILFLIPNHDYKMDQKRSNVLITSSGKTVEALLVDTSIEYDCTEIKFGEDSVTTNTNREYKLVMNLPVESEVWVNTKYSASPELKSIVLDTVDTDVAAHYTLAVKSDSGKVCRMFLFERDLIQVEKIKEMVYRTPKKEDYNFTVNEQGQKLVAGKVIEGYMILKDSQTRTKKKSSGSKRTKHEYRTYSK